jgi:hypothetical protein
MARIIPAWTDEQLSRLPSGAEAAVHRAARDHLPGHWLVLHGIEWIVRNLAGDAADGEADFLICVPDQGVLVVEVKGGGVSYDPGSGEWQSIDAIGVRHRIKDPFKQAKNGKYSILAKLHESPNWSSLRLGRLRIGHAAIFPDLDDATPLRTPSSPSEIVGGRRDFSDLRRWVERALAFWHLDPEAGATPGIRGVEIIEGIFARPMEARPLLSAQLRQQETLRVQLTEQQARLLASLARHRRVAICGGAGTGKTMLAVEKARRLANEGFRTALLCYNRPLADHLAMLCQDMPALEVMSFHQLCQNNVDRARQLSGRDLIAEAASAYPRGDFFDVHFPVALAYAVDVLPDRYDAVVVDEGQDFREEFWLPIEMLLANEKTSPLYIFFDQNQALYRRVSTFPVQTEPYVLTTNCRNTREIHAAAYRFFRGEPTEPSSIAGTSVETITGPSPTAQARKLHSLVCGLLQEEKVAPADIAVLIANPFQKADCISLLSILPLPKPARWAREAGPGIGFVGLDTVQRFKGLEASIVVLWALGGLDQDRHREVFYVGLSRAKSVLYLIGTPDDCRRVLGEPEMVGAGK